VFSRDHGQWFSWVYIVGNEVDAGSYIYEIKIADCSPEPGRQSVQIYHGMVHPIDERGVDIIASQKCMVISDDTVKRFMSSEGLPRERILEGYDYRLPIEYRVCRKSSQGGEG